MCETVYRELAQRLDATPNGFPSTESGIELRVLEKLFAPEEAKLASVMRLTREPAGDIALRAGIGPGKAVALLQGMAHKSLVSLREAEGKPVFGLMQFVPGIFSSQLARIDEEMATLVEEYCQESRGRSHGFSGEVAFHRVIAVDEAIPAEIEVLPYERASTLLEGAQSWAVRDCICRVQQQLLGRGCEHPLDVCLLLAPFEGAFVNSELDRVLTKAEAYGVLRRAKEAGLVHSIRDVRQGIYYICNCCTCSCKVLRGMLEFGHPTAMAHSDFRSVVNAAQCTGCGDCVESCPFGALSIPGETCVVDYERCMGCGLCVTVCPAGALALDHRPAEEVSLPLADVGEWRLRRAQERGMELEDIV